MSAIEPVDTSGIIRLFLDNFIFILTILHFSKVTCDYGKVFGLLHQTPCMSDQPNPLEQERIWIEKSRSDIAHFRPLYDKYHDPLHRYFVRRTDDYDLSRDLCSNTFFKALDKLHQFKWVGKPFGAWLFKIASNELRKHFRDSKPVYVLEEDKMDCAVELDIEGIDWQSILVNELDELPEDDLRILELKFFEHSSFKEISALLDISESAAKMRVYRLLSILRNRMENHDQA